MLRLQRDRVEHPIARCLTAILLFALLVLATEAWAGHNESYSSSTKSPANPTGTTNTTGLMMGLAGALTPRQTGRVLIIVNGDIINPTSGDASKIQLRFGIGTAPSNGAAATGTALGGFVNAGTSTSKYPFTVMGLASGLTINTAIWIDVQLAAVTGGTASILDVNIVALEF